MLGFKGNRPLACKLLQVSAETPECGKAIESSLILYVMKFWLLDERDAAVELLEGLKKSLPNSPLIYLMHGWCEQGEPAQWAISYSSHAHARPRRQCMIKDKDTDRALENYRAGWELAHIPQLRLGFTQQMAWAHYLREDWEDVVRLTEQFLAETKNKDSGSYSAFSMGLALHMLGRADQSKLAMEKCVAIAEKVRAEFFFSLLCSLLLARATTGIAMRSTLPRRTWRTGTNLVRYLLSWVRSN